MKPKANTNTIVETKTKTNLSAYYLTSKICYVKETMTFIEENCFMFVIQ